MCTAGAGDATMFARLIGAILMIFVLFRGKTNVQLKKTDSFKLHTPTLKRLFSIGIPAGIEQIFMQGAQLFFTMIVTNLGTAMYAAHQVVLRADSLAFMPGFGFSVAATALVGQNLGAKQPDEAKRAGKITMYMAIALMTAVGILLFIFARQAMIFFTNDIEVIEAGIPILKMMAFSMPFMAVARVSAGALRGAGDTKFVMWGTGASIWLARLVTAFILVNVFNLGLMGAWIGMFADHVVRALIFLARFLKGKWIFIKI